MLYLCFIKAHKQRFKQIFKLKFSTMRTSILNTIKEIESRVNINKGDRRKLNIAYAELNELNRAHQAKVKSVRAQQ